MQYKMDTVSNSTTLEGFKDYYKNDEELEYILLYKDIETLIEEEEAQYTKVKLKDYKYIFTLNDLLEIIEIDGNKQENIKKPEENINNFTALINTKTSNTSGLENCFFKGGEESGKEAYKAFDNDIETQANSALIGQTEDYIEYDFKDEIKINYVELQYIKTEHIFSNCRVTASLDGENWDTILETDEFISSKLEYLFEIGNPYNNREYKYVRIWQIGTRKGGGDNRMCISEIQIYGTKTKTESISKLINTKTSNTSGMENCFFKGGEESGKEAYKAFDNDIETQANSALTGQTEDYIEYDFKDKIKIKYLELRYIKTDHIFSNCKVTASLDGENWDTILETDKFSRTKLEYLFEIGNLYNNREYKYVRIWQIGTRKGGGDNRMCISEIQMYGTKTENLI